MFHGAVFYFTCISVKDFVHFVIFRKIIYRADVANDRNSDKKFYFGLANTFFKERYRNHIRYFKDENYENSTELALYLTMETK